LRIGISIPTKNPQALERTLRVFLDTASGKHEVVPLIVVDEAYDSLPDAIVGTGNHQKRVTDVMKGCDVYIAANDNMTCQTVNWDEIIVEKMALYPAFSWTEESDPENRTLICMTQVWLDKTGGFPDCFPFWFVDTWMAEICELIYGEKMPIIDSLRWSMSKERKSRKRNLSLWFQYFAFTRSKRIAIAEKISGRSPSGKTIESMNNWDAYQQTQCSRYEKVYVLPSLESEKYKEYKNRAKQEMSLPRKVMIAVPCYTGTMHAAFCSSLLEEHITLIQNGILAEVKIYTGMGIVHKVRNSLLADFLMSDCDDIVFIDDDIQWERGSVLKLLSVPEDIVGGSYLRKKESTEYVVQWKTENKELWSNEHGLIEVEGLAGGFTKLSRKAAEDLAKNSIEIDEPCSSHGAAWRVYDYNVENRTEYGEDFSMCRKAASLGYKIWLHPELKLNHFGLKNYEGHVGEWLRKRA